MQPNKLLIRITKIFLIFIISTQLWACMSTRPKLLQATLDGKMDIIEELIKKGADVNTTDKNGVTSLHIAATKKIIKLIRLLVEKGANVNATTHLGITPLHHAAINGDLEIGKFLIANGAEVNASADFAITPLHFVAKNGHTELAKLLIENGANVNATDKNGVSVFEYAAISGNLDIARLLIKNNAHVDDTILSKYPTAKSKTILSSYKVGHTTFAQYKKDAEEFSWKTGNYKMKEDCQKQGKLHYKVNY